MLPHSVSSRSFSPRAREGRGGQTLLGRPASPQTDAAEFREIALRNGGVALVDAADFDWLNQWKWSQNADGYAVRFYGKKEGGDGKRILMHRVILTPAPGQQGDHVNGDRLDNRRANLRCCSPRQNSWNVAKRSTSPGYKGVSREPTSPHLWRARIRVDDKPVWLGTFNTQEEAARAYDAAAIAHYGEFARTNFTDASAVPPPRRERSIARGERVKGAKLTGAAVVEIRQQHASGLTMYRIAKLRGLSFNTVSFVVRGITWRHVGEAS